LISQCKCEVLCPMIFDSAKCDCKNEDLLHGLVHGSVIEEVFGDAGTKCRPCKINIRYLGLHCPSIKSNTIFPHLCDTPQE
jgi:hypothetical protein